MMTLTILCWFVFQSTSPSRGTTCKSSFSPFFLVNFNPRPPRGERRDKTADRVKRVLISIHVPLAGNDVHSHFTFHDFVISIHVPLAGNDANLELMRVLCIISIHVPLAGNDLIISFLLWYWSNFNPRSPRGERHLDLDLIFGENRFQSTFPSRGTTTSAGILRIST